MVLYNTTHFRWQLQGVKFFFTLDKVLEGLYPCSTEPYLSLSPTERGAWVGKSAEVSSKWEVSVQICKGHGDGKAEDGHAAP
jgi:hypothetical protein